MHAGTKVLIRQKGLYSVNLAKAEVLSHTGDTLRVVMESDRKLNGTKKPVEVKASEVILASSVFGTRPGSGVVPKSYATSINALSNILNK
jgi:hypothetical protein